MDDIITFHLDGRIPSKKNSKQIFQNKRTGKPFITTQKNYKSWHTVQSLQLNLQKSKYNLPIKKCEKVTLKLFYGDYLVADNTNKADSIHDLLVDNGILEDDNWKVTGRTEQIPIYRKGQAGCEIIIQVAQTEIPESA